ncbi:MAG: class I SAM-dependent methyltransferase [Desulfobacterium sp.]|nr:class I SAM-dependent methyltransferase [Desulfobacterium sp.]MBU3949674.1 class I SAM-dependent methyltransferase [Pseudomonadota bacterium]MBU4009268.1 class I SAM-dependent methyltransferase [Pseudomonadota bacterium]MBU4036152.1 class I SAM-dependent methyltransferase [Pseudomonadota bacterium]
MPAIDEKELSMLLSPNVDIRLIEPHIYSVLSDIEVGNTYDTQFGNIYDWVACNPIYNRLLWGYSAAIFAFIASDALRLSKKGNVLDLGCGSLAFTAKTYIQYPERPVVLVDQSLKMLKIAKSRLIKINGTVPDNMVFLHADALRLPFHDNSFNTIISENLLHCLDDTENLLKGLKEILSEDGKIYFTTLVKCNRVADRYLGALANAGKLVSRNIEDHQAIFEQLGMPIKYEVNGNMASIYYGE